MKELALGLLCVMGANVLLESVIGKFGDHFTFRCFMVIITKYLCIIVSFVLLYVAAYYNPDVIVANINNSNVSKVHNKIKEYFQHEAEHINMIHQKNKRNYNIFLKTKQSLFHKFSLFHPDRNRPFSQSKRGRRAGCGILTLLETTKGWHVLYNIGERWLALASRR